MIMTRSYPRTKGIALTALFATLLAIFSLVSIPIPISPVPVTLQVLIVFIIVNLLGPFYGTLACAVYLLFGSIGLPVFAGGSAGPAALFGPFGGYLFAFPVSALIGGAISGRRSHSKKSDTIRVVIATSISLIIIYLMGVIWLSESSKISVTQAFVLGAAPFIPVDVAKAFLAVPLSIYFRWSRADLPIHMR